MLRTISWLIVGVFATVLPVALAIAHSHYLTKLDIDTQQVMDSVESVLGNRSLTKEQKQVEIINLVAQKPISNTTVFVYDTNGKMIFHPKQPELNGRVLTSHADPIVANAFRDLVKSANAYTESQVVYNWRDPAVGQIQNQVAFIRRVDDWNWVFAATQEQVSLFNWRYLITPLLVVLGIMLFPLRTKLAGIDPSSAI